MLAVMRSAKWLKARRADFIFMLGVMAVAGAVRASFVLDAGFPLNDGGMFHAAVSDIEANSWRVPQELSYNGAGIPFAYPPLAFYIARLFEVLTGAGTLAAQRILPAAFSTAAVGVFYLLAREITGRAESFVAAWMFALVPHSYDWEIGGGGLTRAPGLFFALVAILFLYRIAQGNGSRLAIAGSGVFAGLAVLAHLQMGLFVGYSAAVFALLSSGRREAVRRMGVAAVLATALVGPWLLWVIVRLGVGPLVAASQTGTHGPAMVQVLGPSAFSEPLFPIVAALGGVGFAWAIGRREWLLPAWVVAVVVLDPRKAETLATIPVALLGAKAMFRVVLPLLSGTKMREPGFDPRFSRLAPVERLGMYTILGFILLGTLLAPMADGSPLRAIGPDARHAAGRLKLETPPTADVLVVTGQERWALDALSEWFPVLSGRSSVATVQGTEWLPGHAFADRIDAYEDVQVCADQDPACLERWSARYQLPFDHVFIAYQPYARPAGSDSDGEDCCAMLRWSLLHSPDYELLFDEPGGTAFRRREHEE